MPDELDEPLADDAILGEVQEHPGGRIQREDAPLGIQRDDPFGQAL
jgi:hypothetical protein